MNHLKKNSSMLLVVFALASASLQAEAVCHRCEEIRADNALHHKNFEYYEEYLKTQESQSAKPDSLPKPSGDEGQKADAPKSKPSTSKPLADNSKKKAN